MLFQHFSSILVRAQNPNLGCTLNGTCKQISIESIVASNAKSGYSATNPFTASLTHQTDPSKCYSSNSDSDYWQATVADGLSIQSLAVFRGKCNNCDSCDLNDTYIAVSSSASINSQHTTFRTPSLTDSYGFVSNMSTPITSTFYLLYKGSTNFCFCQIYAFKELNIVVDATSFTSSLADNGSPDTFSAHELSNACSDKPDLSFVGQENLGSSHVTIGWSTDRSFSSVIVFACLDDSNNIYGMSDGYSLEVLDSSDNVVHTCGTGFTTQMEIVCNATGRKIKISSSGNGRLNIAKVMAFEGDPVICATTSFTSNMSGITETVEIYSQHSSTISFDYTLTIIPDCQQTLASKVFTRSDTTDSVTDIAVDTTQSSNWIWQDTSVDAKININTSDLSLAGTYTIQYTALLNDGTTSLDETFNLILVNKCLDVVINSSQSFSTMITFIGHNISQAYSLATPSLDSSTTTYCGNVLYKILLSDGTTEPTWLTLDTTNQALALSTSTDSDAQIASGVKFRAYLEDDASVFTDTAFDVHLYKIVTSSISNETRYVPNSSQTPITFDAFTISPSLEAGDSYTLQYQLISPPTWMSIDSDNREISFTPGYAEAGQTYTITVRGELVEDTSIYKDITFDLTITCSCTMSENTIDDLLLTTSTVNYPSADDITLALFNSDMEATAVSDNCSISCPVTYELTSPSTANSWTTISGTNFIINAANIDNTVAASQPITLTFTTYLTAESSITADHDLIVSINICDVTSFVTTDMIGQTKTIDVYTSHNPLNTYVFTVQQSPSCGYNIDSTQFRLHDQNDDAVSGYNPVPTSQSTNWLWQDTTTDATIKVQTTDSSLAGTYKVYYDADLGDLDSSQIRDSFTLILVDKCASATIDALSSLSTMTTFIGYEARQSYSTTQVRVDGSVSSYCGDITYEVKLSDGSVSSFITLDTGTNEIVVDSSDISDAQILTGVVFRAYLTEKPSVEVTETFDVHLYSVTTNAAPGDTTRYVPDSAPASISYNDFTISPPLEAGDIALYSVSYSLQSSPAWLSIDTANSEIDITTLDYSAADTASSPYTVTLAGTIPGVSGFTPLTQSFDLTVECSCSQSDNSIVPLLETSRTITPLGPDDTFSFFNSDTTATDASVNCPYSISCPVTTTLTSPSPAPAWLEITEPQLGLIGSSIPISMGQPSQTISLEFTSVLDANNAITSTHNLDVIINPCVITSFTTNLLDSTLYIYPNFNELQQLTFTVTQQPACEENVTSNTLKLEQGGSDILDPIPSSGDWVWTTLSDDLSEITLNLQTSDMTKASSYKVYQNAVLENGSQITNEFFNFDIMDACLGATLSHAESMINVVGFIGQTYTIDLPAYSIKLSNGDETTKCGSLVYETRYQDDSSIEYIQIDSSIPNLIVSNTISAQANLYNDVWLKVYIDENSSISDIQTYSIHLYELFSSGSIQDQTITSPNTLTLTVPLFETLPSLDPSDSLTIEYKVEGCDLVSVSANTDVKINFIPTSSSKADIYTIKLTGFIQEQPDILVSESFQLALIAPISEIDFTLPEALPPTFEQAPVSVTVFPGIGLTIKLPSIIDLNDPPDDSIELNVDLGKASLFASYNEATDSIIIDQFTTEVAGEQFPVTITLSNSHGLSSTYNFNINIQQTEEEEEEEEEKQDQSAGPEEKQVDTSATSKYHISMEDLQLQVDAYEAQFTPGVDRSKVPRLQIKSISNFGKMDMWFSEEMIITQNITDMIGKTYLGFVDQLEDQEQRRLLQESQDIEKANETNKDQDQVFVNSYMQLVLHNQNVEMFTQEELIMKQFTWKIISFDETTCDIQLTFSSPLHISLRTGTDEIKLQIIDYEQFKSIDNLKLDPQKQYQKLIPKQMINDSAGQALAAFNDSMDSSMKSVMVSNFAMNAILSMSLQYLWSMLRIQQLIVHIPLCNIEFPGNAFSFFMVIFTITAFDLAPTDDIYDSISKEVQVESLQLSFENLGYESKSFIRNLGTSFVFAFYLLVILPFIFKCKNGGCCVKYKKIHKKLISLNFSYFWSVPLRFLYENCMIIAVSALINFTQLIWDSWLDLLSTLNTLLFTALNIFMIWLAIWLYNFRYQKLKTVIQYRAKYNPMINGLKYQKTEAICLIPIMHVLRRWFLGIIVVQMRYVSAWFQSTCLFLSSTIVIITFGYLKPYDSSFMTKLEMFNETCLLIMLYMFFQFSDWFPDLENQYICGWFFIFVNATNMLINLIILFSISGAMLYRSFRRKWIVRRELKKVKEKMAADKYKIKQFNRQPTILVQIKELSCSESSESSLESSPSNSQSQSKDDSFLQDEDSFKQTNIELIGQQHDNQVMKPKGRQSIKKFALNPQSQIGSQSQLVLPNNQIISSQNMRNNKQFISDQQNVNETSINLRQASNDDEFLEKMDEFELNNTQAKMISHQSQQSTPKQSEQKSSHKISEQIEQFIDQQDSNQKNLIEDKHTDMKDQVTDQLEDYDLLNEEQKEDAVIPTRIQAFINYKESSNSTSLISSTQGKSQSNQQDQLKKAKTYFTKNLVQGKPYLTSSRNRQSITKTKLQQVEESKIQNEASFKQGKMQSISLVPSQQDNNSMVLENDQSSDPQNLESQRTRQHQVNQIYLRSQVLIDNIKQDNFAAKGVSQAKRNFFPGPYSTDTSQKKQHQASQKEKSTSGGSGGNFVQQNKQQVGAIGKTGRLSKWLPGKLQNYIDKRTSNFQQ